MALCPGLPEWAGSRKVKPIWILLKQETVSGSGISWAICKSAPCSREITTPAPHHSGFLPAGCPSCCPTNSVKALKTMFMPLLSAIIYWSHWFSVFIILKYDKLPTELIVPDDKKIISCSFQTIYCFHCYSLHNIPEVLWQSSGLFHITDIVS